MRGAFARLSCGPAAIAVGAAGVIVGLLLRLQFLPYSLPGSTANVLGAAVGAMFAV